MTSRRTAVLAIASCLLLMLVMAPAWGNHDNGKGKSQDHHASDQEAQGNKAENSDDGEKPFDEEPNDHPSGKDKSEEPGGSDTQGKSTSDPDGDANGGADKPCELLDDCAAEQGGFDSDHDGNNGCGNDDDFEDDNNGWCGKPEEVEVEAVTVEKKEVPTTVLGARISRPEVAPAVAERASLPIGSVLPFTGLANVFIYVALALMLLVMGTLAIVVAGERRA
ncbi:MAG: hypothetical protein ABR505_07870 [Actinomycetota bacterium]